MQVTLLVRDCDEAAKWFCSRLGFSVKSDEKLAAGKRWLVLDAGGGADLVLARAVNDEQRAAIGRQAGGRVGFFLKTEDFERDVAKYADAGVQLLERPRSEPYGKVVQFADLYGNKWDLIEPI
ncbi:MAG: VOC family protein [Pseudomonadota bacterium]